MPDPRQQLTELIQQFARQNGRMPTDNEVRDMMQRAGLQPPSRFADVARQTLAGPAESALTSVGGIASLTGIKPLQDLSERLRAALPSPQTRAGSAARTTTRIAGDIGQFFIPGAAITKIGKLKQLTSLASAGLRAARPATRARVTRALGLMRGGASLTQASRAAGVSTRTMHRYADDVMQQVGRRFTVSSATEPLSRGKRLAVDIASAAPVSAAIGAGDPENSTTAVLSRILPENQLLKDMIKTPAGAAIGDVVTDMMLGIGLMRVLPSAMHMLNQSKRGRNVFTLARASMTAQPATAVRNLAVGGARTVIETVDDAAAGVVVQAARKVFGDVPGQLPIASGRGAVQAFTAMYGAMKELGINVFTKGKNTLRKRMESLRQIEEAAEAITRRERDEIKALIKSGDLPAGMTLPEVRRAAKVSPIERLERTPGVEDVDPEGFTRGLRGYVNALQLLNRSQEVFVRHAAFASHFAQGLARRGLNPDTAVESLKRAMNKSQTSGDAAFEGLDDILKLRNDAVTHALDVTFALQRQDFGEFGQWFLGLYDKFPVFFFVHPFQRFLANSTKYLFDRTAVWGKWAKPEFWKAIRKGGDAEIDALGKMTEGVGLFSAAMFARTHLAGPKWYQLKVGEDSQGNEQFADMRPFAPLAIPLLVAETARKSLGEQTQLEGSDYVEAFAGIRRLAGTAIGGMFDIERMESSEQFTDWVERFSGDMFGMFSTPFRTFKDLATLYDDEEDVALDKNVELETPIGPSKFFNAFLANIPGAGKALLPPVPRPTRGTFFGEEEDLIPGVPNPVLRQVTGLSIQTRTPLEKEIDRLGIQPRTRTGVQVLDKLTDAFMGLAISKSNVDDFVQSDDYFTLDDFGRKTLLRGHMTEVRSTAKAVALREGGEEVMEEIIATALKMQPDKWEEYLSNLAIPQEWKDTILQAIRQRSTPNSITGEPIAALEAKQGPEAAFIRNSLTLRTRNIPV